MSLATSCPSCGTVFRVVQDQLKVSEGWVRCGHCQEVFNALEGLFDLARRDTNTHSGAPDLATPATANTNDPAWLETRPAMFSDSRVLRERQEVLQKRPPAPPPPPPPSPPKRVEISTRQAATWDPSIKEPEQALAPTQPDPGVWRTTGGGDLPPVPMDSLLADMDPAPGPAPVDATDYAATTLEFRSEAFSALAAAPVRPRQEARPEIDLALDDGPAPTPPIPPTPATETTAPPPAQAPAAVIVVPVEAPWPAAVADIEDLEKTLDLSALEATEVLVQAEPEEVEPAHAPVVEELTPAASATRSPPSDKSPEPSALPDFVRRADRQARWHHPAVRAALGLTAVLLLGGLAVQATHHWHDLIAARWPVTHPVLSQACQQWHCQLQAPQQLDALVVDSTTLSRPPGTDSYLLGVTLHNRAAHAIAAPHIELSLTDLSGAVVLRRVLTPAEFRQADTLPAQRDASWQLEFASTNQRIAGYTLAAFYP